MSQDSSGHNQNHRGSPPLETAPRHGARALRALSNLRHGSCLGWTLGWSPGYESLPVQIMRSLFFGASKWLTALWTVLIWALELIIWNLWFVPATGAKPIDGLFGAILFLLGVSAFGRLVGAVSLVFALWLVLVGGGAHWLDMTMSAGPLAVYGLFCYIFGGDDDEDEGAVRPESAGVA